MERRLYPPARRRTTRHAHPAGRERPAAPVLILLACLLALGTPPSATPVGPAPLDAHGLDGSIAAAVASSGDAPAPGTALREPPAATPGAAADPGWEADPVRPATSGARPPILAFPLPPARAAVLTRAKATHAGATRPVAAFLGDSYTTGWAGAGIGSDGWPAIVARAYGWEVRNRAVAGTGFVNPGWTGRPIGTRVAEVIRLRPGVIVVAGGHNDRRYGSDAGGRAADRVLDRLHAGVPGALIVVVGPIWQDGSPPASILGLRDHLRRKARAIGALFIDPIRDGWFTGANARFICADGIHPTQAGHRHIAAMVLRKLRADPRLAG